MMIASWTQFHVSAFNQEKALVGAFSVITNLRMVLFEALLQERLYSCPDKFGVLGLEPNVLDTSTLDTGMRVDFSNPIVNIGNTEHVKDNRIGHEILTLIFSFNYV